MLTDRCENSKPGMVPTPPNYQIQSKDMICTPRCAIRYPLGSEKSWPPTDPLTVGKSDIDVKHTTFESQLVTVLQ